jgi:hypothetical protein
MPYSLGDLVSFSGCVGEGSFLLRLLSTIVIALKAAVNSLITAVISGSSPTIFTSLLTEAGVYHTLTEEYTINLLNCVEIWAKRSAKNG